MNNNFKIETMAEGRRWFYTCTKKNSKDESLVIGVMKCENSGSKNSLPELWYKNGYTDQVLETYWNIQTYVTDAEGNCYGRYNPTVKRSDDRKRNIINFDYMFEATEENLNKLIDEVYNKFMNANNENN